MDQRMMIFRRVFQAGIVIACLAYGPLLQACNCTASKNEGGKETAMTGSIPNTVRPPIDVAAPAKTETATFALG